MVLTPTVEAVGVLLAEKIIQIDGLDFLMMKERVREVREREPNRDVMAAEGGNGLFQLPALEELWKTAYKPQLRY